MQLSSNSIILLIMAIALMPGCVILDYTDKSGIARQCYVLQTESTLYIENCLICKGTLTLIPTELYFDKPWHFLDGATRKHYANVPIGEKMIVTEVKKPWGITDGPSYYLKGKLLTGPHNQVFNIKGYYFDYMNYPLRPTSYLKACSA